MKLVASMNLHWTAGFLEGEGSFFLNARKPGYGRSFATVKAVQVDRECIDKLRSLYGGSVQLDKKVRSTSQGQPLFEWRMTGERAVDLMERLRPLMSSRRRAQIDKVLDEYALREHA